MKYITEQLYTTLGFSASASSQLAIGAKSYWITSMLIEWETNYNTGVSPVAVQDMPFRGITSFQIQGGGRPYYKIGAPDFRSAYWDTRMRLRGRARVADLGITASSAGLVHRYSMPLLFGVNPIRTDDHLNYWDTTAAIAPDPDLAIIVTWGAAGSTTTNSIWGTNVGVATATLLRITLYGVIPERQTEFPKFYPVWNTSQYIPASTFSGLSGTINLNPGFYYRRTLLMFLSGAVTAPPADLRLNGWNSDLISEVAVKTIDGRLPMNQKTWDFCQQAQSQFQVGDDNSYSSQANSMGATLTKMAGSAANPTNPGVGMIDWVTLADTSDPSKADPFYGLNFVSKQVGALQLAFTVDSTGTTGNVTMLHECYLPY